MIFFAQKIFWHGSYKRFFFVLISIKFLRTSNAPFWFYESGKFFCPLQF